MLRGRHGERMALDQMLEALRAGGSRALVMRGEPGVGKTALLDDLAERATGCQVVHAAGVQSEMELAFAGLHQLCAPMLERVDQIPSPQREALHTAFGLSRGPAPDRFLIGLAVLGLLAEAARSRPLVCVVDDAQWLDRASAQVLAFVARRLGAESVALVFAVRMPDGVAELARLPELVVGGLTDADARALLGSVVRGPLDERVLGRMVAETRGNPLALLELPRGLLPAELAGGFGMPGAAALPQQIEDSFRRQLAPLPDDTRQLLLLAAAEPVGDPVLVWRAAQRLGITSGAAAPAVGAEMLEIGTHVRFRHPLLRSAIYRAATPEERRSVHRALAQVTDPEADPDRRAWHRAEAAPTPDEDVASELERSAERARARGGPAAAGAFLERAAALTRDPARRTERTLAAAQAMHQAGAPDSALRLLSLAEATPLGEVPHAHVDLLRAEIAFAVNRGGDAAPLLLKAAEQLEGIDVRLARETYLDALSAAMFVGPFAAGSGVRKAAEAARDAPQAPHPPRAADLLLDGLATRYADGFAEGIPVLRQALQGFRGTDLPEEEGLRWLWLAHVSAVDIWDGTWDEHSARLVELARDTGALTALPLALSMRIGMHVWVGELGAAASLIEELETVTEATGSHLAPYGALALVAWRGREAEGTALIEATLEEAARRGEGIGVAYAHWTAAVLYAGLGRYEDALAAAGQVTEHPHEMGVSTWGSLVELVEAATRTGDLGRAADALQSLTRLTRAGGTDWALGLEARSRALLGDGPAAEADYREAIDRLSRTRVRGELARAQLLYGEWLRRASRRLDAREQLRTAYNAFTAMEMEAFAQRAERELLATGEHVRKRSVSTISDLTAQEVQIARLAGDGLTNAEIASRLFISPRTVEWHLGRIFAKLEITSRRQLQRR
ncbi:LuxR family transcriptional regulator [Pseudonocardia yunnanensis]